MSYNTLQKNLEKLIKDNNYQIADLERKAGVRKNNIYNIIKGISKKPSAELLQAVADVVCSQLRFLNCSVLGLETYDLDIIGV